MNDVEKPNLKLVILDISIIINRDVATAQAIQAMALPMFSSKSGHYLQLNGCGQT